MNRSIKRALLRILDPVDRFALAVNGKKHLPPLHLRWEVGPLRGFESSSAEYRVYLRLFGGLQPDSRVLDVGCGCGQLALELQDLLGNAGQYVGCDIYPPLVRWCQNAIAAHDRRFSFHHLDVRNGLYNPGGRGAAETMRFPPGWGTFDLILLKSVFTHLRRGEAENYLKQIPAFLRRGGRCLASFFLLNEEQRRLGQLNRIVFHPGPDGAAYAVPDVPEAIVAYEEKDILAMAEHAGLTLERPVIYGSWSGRRDGLSHQDLLVLQSARQATV